jgi:hypothetical protein
VVANRRNGEPEQEQCEWCNTTPNSVYNQSQKADKAQSFEEVLGQLDMLTDGEKEWLRSVHNSNITAEREKVPPPVDNKFVADGCAQFGDTPATTEAVFIMNRSLMLENKKLQQQLEARQNVPG